MFEVLAIVVVLIAEGLGLVDDSDEMLFCADSVALINKSLFCSSPEPKNNLYSSALSFNSSW